MEDLAAALDLTFKQVRTWFIEKRRREKSDNGIVLPSSSNGKLTDTHGRNGLGIVTATKIVKGRDSSIHDRDKNTFSCSLKHKHVSSTVGNEQSKKKNAVLLLQDLLTPDYILKKVFRKDGPPLGVQFDLLPSQAFCCYKGTMLDAMFVCCLTRSVHM